MATIGKLVTPLKVDTTNVMAALDRLTAAIRQLERAKVTVKTGPVKPIRQK